MSTGTTAAALPSSTDSSTRSESPPKKYRVSLSKIQALTAQGKARLSPEEIHLFQQRGFLRSETASQALATICETAAAPDPAALPTPYPPTLLHKLQSSEHSSLNEVFRAKSLSRTVTSKQAAQVATLGSSTTSNKHSTRTEARASKQTHPPFHNQIFEDTCSHLHPTHPDIVVRTSGSPSMDISTSFRRHSECLPNPSTRQTGRSASLSTLSSYSTLASVPHVSQSTLLTLPDPNTISMGRTPSDLDNRRRSSMSPAPVVPSPLGLRTVLYAASPALTLYSLPTTSIDEAAVGPPVSHTTAMDAFQFPATAPSPTQTAISTFRIAQTYPSAAPTASSPLISTSSPTLPATPTAMRSKRKSIPMRSPSWTDSQELSPGVIFQMPFGYLRSAKSPSLTGSEDGTAGNTPPSHYPSPASSIRRSVSGPDVSEHNLFNGQTTPASPLTRSGLGIRVQEDYSEQEATHPLDQPINLSNQDASVEQASVSDESDLGQDPAVNGQGASTAMETDEQISQDSMPTPPSTSTVSATLRMETPNGGTSNPRHVLDTPQSEKAQQNVESIAVSVIVTAMEIATPQPQHASIDLKETDPQREGSKDSPTIAQEDDPSLLPLWAQRWLSIRRQSLIPRNELDFVKGSGILPPPSTDLVIPGGARIKAYPPLLSDFVKFQEELEAKQTEQDSEMAAQNGGSNGGKRRKAGAGKGRGSISTQGARQDDDADEYVGADQIHSTSLKRRRSSHTIQEADVLEEGDFHGPGRGTSRHRRRAHGVDGHGSFSPSISPPAQDEAAYQQNNHASSQPMKLGSPVELSSSTFERGSLRRGPKGKDKLTAKARQTAGGRHDHRDLSWEEPHDIEDEEQYLDGYSDAEGRLRSISNQRRASITASTSGPREKGKGKKDTRLTQKRIGGKNFAVDPNDTEEENSRVEFLQAHDRERYHAGSYGVIPVSEAEFEAIRAREIMDLQRSGRGYHQFKTLKPLLNAIQSEDESVGESSLDGRSRKGNAAGRGGYLNNNINNRVNGGLEAARKRSIQEEVSDLSSSVSKKAKHNITKASRKGGSHADVGTGGPKRGRKAGDARHSIHGSNDESLAMAEALMEMHDGTVDDDETEDEFVPYRGGVDDDHSDSQDDREASGGRLHERVMHQDKAVNQKRANGKMSTPKTLKTAAATAGGTTSPQQPKKKKPTVADPSKLKQHNKAKVSISGAGHHGGSIFSMAGQGFGHGATTTASSKHCEACGANDTPCWRPGYIVNTVLCNSCGLRYKKSNVFCTKVECKYIPLKTEYASMEADRVKHERDHLVCIQCKGRVALPIPKEAS